MTAAPMSEFFTSYPLRCGSMQIEERELVTHLIAVVFARWARLLSLQPRVETPPAVEVSTPAAGCF